MTGGRLPRFYPRGDDTYSVRLRETGLSAHAPARGRHVAVFELFVANVAEAGDIVLLGVVLALTLVVGAGLFALDTVVARLHANREAKTRASRDRDPVNGTDGA